LHCTIRFEVRPINFKHIRNKFLCISRDERRGEIFKGQQEEEEEEEVTEEGDRGELQLLFYYSMGAR
jgi:hypothetical protein